MMVTMMMMTVMMMRGGRDEGNGTVFALTSPENIDHRPAMKQKSLLVLESSGNKRR